MPLDIENSLATGYVVHFEAVEIFGACAEPFQVTANDLGWP